MLPALAKIEDLEVRVPGGIDSGDRPRAQAALDDASATIRSTARKTWTTGSELDDDVPDIVVTICLKAAVRALVNPDGVTEESIDGYSAGYSNESPDVYLTKKEEQMIRQAAGTSRLGVQRLTRGDVPDTPTVFVDTVPSGEKVPWLASPDPY